MTIWIFLSILSFIILFAYRYWTKNLDKQINKMVEINKTKRYVDSIDLESDDTYFFGIIQTHIDHFKIKDILLDYSKDEKEIFVKYKKIDLDQNVKLVVYLIKMEVEDNIIKNWTKIKEITPQIYDRSENQASNR
jgi:hypothetical protein